MSWFESNEWTPRDGEKILFHCSNWKKTSWEVGRYNRHDGKIYNHYSGRTYLFYEWKDVDYWCKIPAVPDKKKGKER